MLPFLCSLFFLAGPTLQDADYEALIVRLRWSDPKDREQAAAKLASAGADVAPHLERALAKAKDPEVIARIEQVKARIRLKLHTPALDDAFSKAFRQAAPDLVKSLRNPDAEVLLKAVEAVTGYTGRRGGRRFMPFQGEKIEEASRSDAILVFRIVLSVIPPLQAPEDEWALITAAMSATAHQFKTTTLHEDCLYHLATPDPEFRRVVFEMSEVGHRRRFISTYLEMLESNDPKVEMHAAWKLRSLNPGDFAPAIAAMIGRTTGRIKANLIESLARTGDPQWKPMLLRCAVDPDSAVQGSAVRSLALLDPKAAAPHVIRMLNSPDSQLLQAGVHAAMGVSDREIAAALERIILKSPDASAAGQALYALDFSDTPHVASILEKAMRHSSIQVRNTAAIMAGWIEKDSLVRALVSLLDDPESAIRGNAATSLGRLKVKGHEEKIRGLLQAENSYTRAAAARALGLLADAGAIPLLEAMVTDEDHYVQSQVLAALAAIDASKFKGLMMKGLESKDALVRITSSQILAKLGDLACLEFLLGQLEGENESSAIDSLMRLRCPGTCRDIEDLKIDWPADQNPTVKEVLHAVAGALKTKGVVLKSDVAPVDEKPRIRRNSAKVVMGLLYSLIPSSLGQEYGWYMDEGTLHLLPIDDARRLWREWAQKQQGKK